RAAAVGALGRPDQARGAQAEAARRFPDDLGVRRMLLAAARDAGDGRAVQRYGAAVLALEPGDQAARLLLVRQFQKDGDNPAALRVLEPLAATIDAAPDGTALLLGTLRLQAARARDAIPPPRHHLVPHPGDLATRRPLAGALSATRAGWAAARPAPPRRPD